MANNSDLIYQQIQQTAGFYPPLVYNLMTWFSALTTTNDELSTNYSGQTDVQPQATTLTLPFVIGFLPPSAPVTGLPLLRTTTDPGFNTPTPSATTPPVNNTGPSTNTPGQPGGNGGPPSYTKFSTAQIAGLVNQVYSENGTPPNPELVWMLTAQSLRETSGNRPDNNPGFINSGAANPSKFSVLGGGANASNGAYSQWDSYPTPQAGVQSFINQALRTPAAQQAALNGDVQAYVAALGASGYYGAYTDSQGVYHDAAQAQQEYLNNFQALYNQAQAAAPNPSAVNLTNIPGTTPPPLTGDVGNPSGWQQQGGSTASQQAAATNDLYGNTSITQAQQQGALQAQQQIQVNVLQQLITQMTNTPPLRLLVNPRSFKNSLEKITADGNWGRNGPIIEHWGEQLDKIEGSGKVAAFFAQDNQALADGSVGNDPGLSRMTRNYSTSYQNLLSLYLIYRNNGGIWTQDYVSQGVTQGDIFTYRTNLAVLGSIYIYYDNILYVGSFDNFSISESDEAPFSLEYSFSFTARAWFLLDQQENPLNTYQAATATVASPTVPFQPYNFGLGADPSSIPVSNPEAFSDFGSATASGGGSVPLPATAAQFQQTESENALFGGNLGLPPG